MLTVDILFIAVLVLFVLLTISTYYAIKFALIIIKIEDSINESLDILDESYNTISIIASKPIFFDSVEIRSVIAEITNTKDAVLAVANKLSSFAKSQEFYAEENKKDSKEEEEAILWSGNW